eukprot:m.767366 g.767366  ORF g.767366 m.767366 type:complete len:687 (+) comp59070_c1_seq4:236-2296(+)
MATHTLALSGFEYRGQLFSCANTFRLGHLEVADFESRQGITARISGPLQCASAPAHGLYAVASYNDRCAFLLDSRTLEVQQLIVHTQGVYSVCFVPGTSLLLSGDADGNIKVTDFGLRKVVHLFRAHKSFISDIVVSTVNPSIVYSASADCTISTFDLRSPAALSVMTGHADTVSCLKLIAGDKLLVSGSKDQTLKVWDCALGRLVKTLEFHQASVQSLVVHPSDLFFASGAADRLVALWSCETLELLGWFECDSAVCSLQFMGNSQVLFAGIFDIGVCAYDCITGQPMSLVAPHAHSVWGLSYDPPGDTVRQTRPEAPSTGVFVPQLEKQTQCLTWRNVAGSVKRSRLQVDDPGPLFPDMSAAESSRPSIVPKPAGLSGGSRRVSIRSSSCENSAREGQAKPSNELAAVEFVSRVASSRRSSTTRLRGYSNPPDLGLSHPRVSSQETSPSHSPSSKALPVAAAAASISAFDLPLLLPAAVRPSLASTTISDESVPTPRDSFDCAASYATPFDGAFSDSSATDGSFRWHQASSIGPSPLRQSSQKESETPSAATPYQAGSLSAPLAQSPVAAAEPGPRSSSPPAFELNAGDLVRLCARQQLVIDGPKVLADAVNADMILRAHNSADVMTMVGAANAHDASCLHATLLLMRNEFAAQFQPGNLSAAAKLETAWPPAADPAPLAPESF